jgi:hypothetical protein
MRVTRAAVAVPSMAIAFVLTLGVLSPTVKAEFGPGCDPQRASVAHRSGGEVVQQPPLRIVCATETGQYTGETTIGVTDSGTVWFSAADWEWALVKSHDQGETWEKFVVPGPQAYPGCGGGVTFFTPCDDSQQSKYNTVADAFLWVDPDTSKIFWSKTYGYALCSSMNMSADDGETWAPVTSFACPGGDYEKIAGGPAPEGGAQPEGYPNVLYACVNGPAPTFVVGPHRVCYKSLDGGETWDPTGVPVTPHPKIPGCLHFQEPQTVGPDGTLFLPIGCAADTESIYVAYSHDEATTWDYVKVPIGDIGNSAGLIGGVSIAVDEAGALYVLWPGADEKLYLAVTEDQGASWKGPFQVSAPGVTTGTPRGQIAAREPGHIAIAYYGHPDGDDESTLNGYLTESFDASGDDPLFHSAMLNAPNDPLYFPVESGTRPRNDYLGVTIAPDGTPWTGLVKLLSPTPDDEGFIQSTGFAGRFVFREGHRTGIAVNSKSD